MKREITKEEICKVAKLFLRFVKFDFFPDIQVTVAYLIRESEDFDELFEKMKQIVDTKEDSEILPALKELRERQKYD